MTIVWSLPAGNDHPIGLKIFTKFYPGARAWLRVMAAPSAILLYSNCDSGSRPRDEKQKWRGRPQKWNQAPVFYVPSL